ncbi:MAG TPA: hypothetical protein PKH93_13680 [Chitinophagales bacterium]|nr:hypothetical protein [Chitinophagales bacterium]
MYGNSKRTIRTTTCRSLSIFVGNTPAEILISSFITKGIRLAHEIITKQDTKDESGRSPEFCQMVIDLLRKKFKL